MIHERRYTVLWLGAFGLLVLLLAGCTSLRPQWSHQGRLYDELGNTVPNGNYSIQYRLFHSSSGGTALYTESKTVPVSGGLFTTTIGASTVITPEIFSQPTWVEIAVNGETLTPRQQLLGAPYAASLVPNAVIQGSVPITRTYLTYEDTGSAMTVLNTSSTTTGGNGLLVVNQAAAPLADRGNVAAFQAIAAGGDRTASPATGSYGAKIISSNYRGLYVKSAALYYAAVFDSDTGIQILGGGSCVGCSTAFIGLNSGSEAIQPGDFVVAEGVQVDPDLNIPVMLVRKAASAADPIVGVASSAVTRSPVNDLYGMSGGGFNALDGPAQAGGYLTVVVQGLVEARIDPSTQVAIGDYLTIRSGQALRAAEADTPVAQVLSEAGPSGTVWILFMGK